MMSQVLATCAAQIYIQYIFFLLLIAQTQLNVFYLSSASFMISSCTLLPNPCLDSIQKKGCLDVSRAPPLSDDKYLSVTVCVCVCVTVLLYDGVILWRIITVLPFNHSTVKKSKRMRERDVSNP